MKKVLLGDVMSVLIRESKSGPIVCRECTLAIDSKCKVMSMSRNQRINVCRKIRVGIRITLHQHPGGVYP